MKFIIRNLGWILLIVFFVFMLYLISSQNNVLNTNTNSSTGTISSLKISDELKKEEIKDIIVKEKTTKEVSETKLKIISDETGLELISGEAKITNNSGSFVDSIRNFFTLDNKKVESNTNLKDVTIDKNLVISDEKNIENKEIEKIQNIKSTQIVDEELIKKLDKIIDNKKIITGKVDNKTDGKKIINTKNIIQKVAVKSIFLNNSTFTKRIYTAYKGDELEQLTNTNKFGCFKIKVISSKDIRNNGKTAWTCEYYMEGRTASLQKYQKAVNVYKKNSIKKSTYKVGVSALKLNNANFTKKIAIVYYGDKLEQLTNTNKYGCFKVKVISTKNKINNGKIAWACKKYLK